jgi:hypothetical protein
MEKRHFLGKAKYALMTALFFLFAASTSSSQEKTGKMNYLRYIRENLATKAEIDVFLNELSWAQFDPEIGYTLGNYMPHDGVDNSSTLSTSKPNGARTSFMYADKPCRINTYGNSFTQCHQVSDGETWQEYLAAHLGEPIRNFGMGGLGVYQAYRRMIREEKTEHQARYLIFYIWGDDHIRSLLRCRYMLFKEWKAENEPKEGVGKMFHGNFWANMEMDFATGRFQEKESLISRPQDLYKMTDPAWMVENLKDDLALQMYLFKQKKIDEIDLPPLKKLSAALNCPVDLEHPEKLHESVATLLDQYGFAATEYILNKADEFAAKNDKKLMVVLFDPYTVLKSLLQSGTRYDEQIVDYLQANHFNYFDMNLCHVADYKNFNLSVDDYFKRYFIGHYSPAGNHFFAFSIKPRVVEWLDPKPVTYQKSDQKMIDFKGYLEGMSSKGKE